MTAAGCLKRYGCSAAVKFNELLTAGGQPAGCTAQLPKVLMRSDPFGHAEMIGCPAPTFPNTPVAWLSSTTTARPVAVGGIGDAIEFCQIAVHRKTPSVTIILTRLAVDSANRAFEFRHIGMGIPQAGGPENECRRSGWHGSGASLMMVSRSSSRVSNSPPLASKQEL